MVLLGTEGTLGSRHKPTAEARRQLLRMPGLIGGVVNLECLNGLRACRSRRILFVLGTGCLVLGFFAGLR